MRLHISWAAVIVVFCGACCAVAADNATTAPSDDQQQYDAVAAARTKLELAFHRIHKAMGDAQTQWQTQTALLEQTRTRIAQTIERARDTEAHKDETERSQAFLDELRDRADELGDQWQKFAADDRARMEGDFRRSVEIITGLNNAMQSLAAIEHTYKDLGMNLDAVRAMYETFAAKADEAYEMGHKALDDMTAARKVWTDILADVKNLAKEHQPKDKGVP
jgi:chromosome segregation ATPase